jgi:hypothetical protein
VRLESDHGGLFSHPNAVWESEEWLQANARPLSQSGGNLFILLADIAQTPAGVQGRNAKSDSIEEEAGDDGDAMQE